MRLLLLTLTTLSLFAADAYHVIKRIPIGGAASWDYITVDDAARRLYVTNGARVVVVDLDSEKIVGEIPASGVHGVALASSLNRGFVSNGRANNVTVFDLKTLAVIDTVSTGQNPDAIIFDPASGRVFTFNGRSNDATVIDAASGKVEQTIPMGGKPEFAAVDGKGLLWVNIEDTNEVLAVDTKAGTVLRRTKLDGCDEPTGLAFDAKRRHVFSVCHSKVMVVTNGDTGKIVASAPIGENVDGVVFDAGAGAAFSSNGEGTITMVHESKKGYASAATIKTERSARTIAVDPKTHKLYLPAADFGPPPAEPDSKGQRRPPAIPDSFHVLVVGK